MSQIDFNEVLLSLPGFNEKQLEKIKTTCTGLLQYKSSSKFTAVEKQDWILSGILTELRVRGIENRSEFYVKKSTSFKGYITKAQRVRELLEDAAPGLSSVEKLSLGQIAAYELAQYFGKLTSPKPVILINMLDYVDYIPNAIESSFPGYMGSRMLGVVIKQRF